MGYTPLWKLAENIQKLPIAQCIFLVLKWLVNLKNECICASFHAKGYDWKKFQEKKLILKVPTLNNEVFGVFLNSRAVFGKKD